MNTKELNNETNALSALCSHLGADIETATRERFNHYNLAVFSVDGGEYAVGTDEECDAACADNVKDSLWAFRASFILGECGLPLDLENAIAAYQGKECEGANEALLALVEKCVDGGLESFTKKAVRADGRGHFLSGYDGKEIELAGGFFAYRIN